MNIAILSIIRPEILDKTLLTLCYHTANLFNEKHDIFLNIDNNPIDTRFQQQINVVKKYFPNDNLTVNISNQNNFPMAVKWLYNNILYKNQYTLFLEQDWELMENINLDDYKQLLEEPLNQLHSVNIRAYNNSNKFYMAHCLHKTQFLKYLAQKMTFTKNPEVEARQVTLGDKGFAQYPENIVLKDIGRQYLRKNNIIRDSRDPSKFTKIIKQKDILQRLKNEKAS